MALLTHHRHASVVACLLALFWAAVVDAGAVRCLTYKEKTLNRLQTICDDGTRG